MRILPIFFVIRTFSEMETVKKGSNHMTIEQRLRYLKHGVYKYWIKPNKYSFFKKKCHVCKRTIKKQSFYKVKVYDKHARQNLVVYLCNEHGKELIK